MNTLNFNFLMVILFLCYMVLSVFANEHKIRRHKKHSFHNHHHSQHRRDRPAPMARNQFSVPLDNLVDAIVAQLETDFGTSFSPSNALTETLRRAREAKNLTLLVGVSVDPTGQTELNNSAVYLWKTGGTKPQNLSGPYQTKQEEKTFSLDLLHQQNQTALNITDFSSSPQNDTEKNGTCNNPTIVHLKTVFLNASTLLKLGNTCDQRQQFPNSNFTIRFDNLIPKNSTSINGTSAAGWSTQQNQEPGVRASISSLQDSHVRVKRKRGGFGGGFAAAGRAVSIGARAGSFGGARGISAARTALASSARFAGSAPKISGSAAKTSGFRGANFLGTSAGGSRGSFSSYRSGSADGGGIFGGARPIVWTYVPVPIHPYHVGTGGWGGGGGSTFVVESRARKSSNPEDYYNRDKDSLSDDVRIEVSICFGRHPSRESCSAKVDAMLELAYYEATSKGTSPNKCPYSLSMLTVLIGTATAQFFFNTEKYILNR